jgi:uncharacterized protein
MKIKRNIEKKVREHLIYPEITLLVGPRQVGKTTLISSIGNELKQSGEKVITFNLDFEDDFSQVSSQQELLRRLKLEFGSQKGYVFIDEVQRKENAGLFFKGIYDLNLPYKFILTGSGSVELKEKISESLSGRKQIFEMHPVSFLEFLDFRTNYEYSDRLNIFLQNNDSRLHPIFQEYLEFGGYPRVILAETLVRKREEMQEIYNSYLDKDIVQLLRVQKTDSFSKLLMIIATQIGQGVNIDELSNTIGIDSETVKNYLWYLEKTFILRICRPYFTNQRSELSKTPVYYFEDIGMRNYVQNRFAHFDMTVNGGHLFENFIFNHLVNKYSAFSPSINYWRTKDGAEVDFIFKVGETLIPIEVKYKNLNKPLVGKSMYNFVEKYNPKKSYVVNLHFEGRVTLEEKNIDIIPYNKFLGEEFDFV